MGVGASKRHEDGDDIISSGSLIAVKDSVQFLKQNARAEGLFRRSGRRDLRQKMLTCLKKGERPNFERIRGVGALECAAALQLFLIHLKKPVMPFNIQRLILADNPGIATREIARDALGLIRQDVQGRHGELLTDILDLLRHLAWSAPPSECSELQGSPLPIVLLPVFFRPTRDDLIEWRQVASRFSELIIEAPESLARTSRSEDYRNLQQEGEALRREETEIPIILRDLSVMYPILRLADEQRAY